MWSLTLIRKKSGLLVSICALSMLAAGTVLAGDPIAYWDFHEGAGQIVHDMSGNGNHGTNSGGSWVDSPCPYALEIVGEDLVWLIPQEWDDPIGEDLTVAAFVQWYGPNGDTSSYVLDGRHAYWHLNEWHHTGLILLISPDGRPVFRMFCGDEASWTVVESGEPVSPGAMTHIAVVLDSALQTLTMYINAVPRAEVKPVQGYCQSTEMAAIGNNHWAPGDQQWAPLNGVIDEVRIYNRALGQKEISDLYAECGPVATESSTWSRIKAIYR